MEIQPERTQEFIDSVQEKFSVTVYRLALLQTKRQSVAEAVYREVFLRLVRRQDSFENEEHMKAWLIRTAVQCGRMRRFVPLFRHREPFGTPGNPLYALAALPEEMRTVYLLYEAEGYSVIEIAGLLHRKEPTVRRQLARTRSMLDESQTDVLYEYRLEGLLKSIQAPNQLQRNTAEQMLYPKAGRSPVLKYGVPSALAALILLACILVPSLENRRGNGAPALGNSVQSSESRLAPQTGNDIEITLNNDNKYPSNGISGNGDGEIMTWTEDIDFNLRCTGENIKRVTYTAHNCEFLNKSFFTREQVEARQVNRSVFSSLSGSGEGSSLIYWGFSSIGYVYSADYEEQLNPSYFGLRLNYAEENVNEFENDREKEYEKLFRLSEEAYRKAYITVEAEREDGSVVTKEVRLFRSAEKEPVTILVKNGIVD